VNVRVLGITQVLSCGGRKKIRKKSWETTIVAHIGVQFGDKLMV